MIEKEEFVSIIDKLKSVDEFVSVIRDNARKLSEKLGSHISDFFEPNSFIIIYNDLVVELLENMFHDEDIISWWIYELDYGKNYIDGCFTDENGNDIDISTAEKLYDYLISNLNNSDFEIMYNEEKEKNLELRIAISARETVVEKFKKRNEYQEKLLKSLSRDGWIHKNKLKEILDMYPDKKMAYNAISRLLEGNSEYVKEEN